MNSLKASAIIYQYFDFYLGISAVLYFASIYELKIVEKSFNNYGIQLRIEITLYVYFLGEENELKYCLKHPLGNI